MPSIWKLFGNLNNLLLCNSCEPKKCSFNMNLPFFWMFNVNHDTSDNAKLIQISYKTTIWVLRCKKEVRFSFHFFFSSTFFFFFCPKVGQLLTGKQNTNQPEKIKNMLLQQKHNSNWSSKVMFLRKFMTTTPPAFQKVMNVITQITASSPPTNLQNDYVI